MGTWHEYTADEEANYQHLSGFLGVLLCSYSILDLSRRIKSGPQVAEASWQAPFSLEKVIDIQDENHGLHPVGKAPRIEMVAVVTNRVRPHNAETLMGSNIIIML